MVEVGVAVAVGGEMVMRVAFHTAFCVSYVAFTVTVWPTLRSLTAALPLDVLYLVVLVSMIVVAFFLFCGRMIIDCVLID